MVSMLRHQNGLAATRSAWLVLALSLTTANAMPYLENEIPDTVTYKTGSVAYKPGSDGKGPLGEDLNELANKLHENRTAWGSVPLNYPDISKPWREISPASGWSWDVTLRAGDEVMVASEEFVGRMLYYSEGMLSLQTPTSANGSALPVDEDWNLCLVRWDLGNAQYSDKLRADDGTCSSVLGEQCAAALRKKVEDAFAADGTCGCTTAADVPECASAAADAGPWNSGCHAVAFNASEMAGWKGGRHPFFTYATGGFYDARDTTVYNDLGSVAWPVLSVLSGGGAVRDSGAVYSNSQLACVRATQAADGWEVPSLSAKNTTEAGYWQGEHEGKEDGPVKTNAASGTDIGAFSAALLGVGFLVSAFVI